MLFEYHKKSQDALLEAKQNIFFDLTYLSDESILARYYLCIAFKKYFGSIPSLEKDKTGGPIPFMRKDGKIFHWSISHSENFVAFAIADEPCGIDIAEYEKRNPILLSSHSEEEYMLLGGKNWENFYKLWTSKEALIKRLGGKLDDREDMKLESIVDNSLIFVFLSERYTIRSIAEGSIYISYTF